MKSPSLHKNKCNTESSWCPISLSIDRYTLIKADMDSHFWAKANKWLIIYFLKQYAIFDIAHAFQTNYKLSLIEKQFVCFYTFNSNYKNAAYLNKIIIITSAKGIMWQSTFMNGF